MRVFDTATQNALAAQGIIRRGMILFQFPSGNYGFWDGAGPFVYNTVTYNPGAQLIEIDTGTQVLTLESNAITLKLYANPDTALTEDVLRTIETESYHQRPVTIFKALFNADTKALISVIPIWKGYVDQITQERSAEGFALVGRCESRSIDYTRRGWATASDAQQQQISSGDKGLEYCGIAGQVEVPFGTKDKRKRVVEPANKPVL